MSRGRTTVEIIDDRDYVAENSERVVRRYKQNRLASYEQMYRSICKSVVCGQGGDSYESLRISTTTMLDLAAAVDRTSG
jgi:hypothetical protein